MIGRLHVTAEIGAIDFDIASGFHAFDLGRKRLADFMSKNESGLVLDVEVTGELKRAVALRAIREDGNRHEVVANRELAVGEDGPGRDRELAIASFAFEDRAGLVGVDGNAAAGRANRVAAGGSPTDFPEGAAGLVVAHTRDLRQRERASGGGEEEVLRHVLRSNVLR